jgi:SAM-dependent methyltransferase
MSEPYEFSAGYYDLFRTAPDALPSVQFFTSVSPRGGAVLEIGPGTGRITMAVAERAATVHCVERSPAMRAVLLAKLAQRPHLLGKVTVLPGEAATLRLDRTFDHAFLAGVLEHVPHGERQALFAVLRGHLVDGGTLAMDMVLDTPVPDFPERAAVQVHVGECRYTLSCASTPNGPDRSRLRYVYRTYYRDELLATEVTERDHHLHRRDDVLADLEALGFTLVGGDVLDGPAAPASAGSLVARWKATRMTTQLTAPAVALRPRFDVDRMAAEVIALGRRSWAAQRPYDANGARDAVEIDWRILPLRGPGGDPSRTDPGGPGLDDFADTPHLAAASYCGEVLASIPAPLRSVRLMALGPGARVHEHTDALYGLRYGGIRLHVPVITNPCAVVVIAGHEQHWTAGRLWFGDFGLPHYVRNDGDHPRIHLVIDALVTPELLDLFPAEFLDDLPTSDTVFARRPIPLRPFELSRFHGSFALPAAFLDWESGIHASEPEKSDEPAEITIAEGELELRVTGGRAFGLLHVGAGEFRLRGWTDERSLHIGPTSVRCTIREGRVERSWERPRSAPAG